ncbi:MFS transporter, OFA family, oxalate/formate antiporter [Tessaracoccus bendigoensis DSM 12906]|uniref:MFS transporter, OFA family, oxalate/formate antiporter n=1 Tax=Tessaracoccus bendigoensis DSM 12906 TaxID=1123357 RepID=A0A1M6N5Z3_9ACTN|nr:OFA family MFS transporter [Tessaracoccus bendigoensis]SHJ91090.1 MFS transporter, OFA family, oxalate/formate antiporter [Tessaracoccus bendigoensis DSM 12906]
MRWSALVGGVLIQLVVGGVYAWSLFARALQAPEAMGLGHVQATVPFELAIGMIFVGTSIGGRLQDRSSPRTVALIGSVIYAGGLMLASFARGADDFWLLVVGYGLIGGFGLGMAYIVPIALLQKWFPKQRALVTGIAVGGFGFGATLTSPVAQRLLAANPEEPASAFLWIGAGYLVLGVIGSLMMFTSPTTASAASDAAGDYTVKEALRTPQWYLLTGILVVAVAAGISLISMMATASVEVAGFDVAAAATVVGVLALFNGAGRIVWAAVAQKVGPLPVLAVILGLEGLALIALPHTAGAAFIALAAVVYLCYGGAFGTLPAAAGSFFGLTHAGAIYGLILVGWSLAGVLGPLAASSLVGEAGNYRLAFSVMGALAVAGVALPLLTRPPRRKVEAEGAHAG